MSETETNWEYGDHDGPGAGEVLPPALDCWYLTGPTAAGKTTVSLELARRARRRDHLARLDGRLSRHGYWDGQALTRAVQDGAHHLISMLDPTDEFSVSNYVEAAHAKIAETAAGGQRGFVCGWHPHVPKGHAAGALFGPPADWDFRREVEEEARQVGIAALHARLAQVDPLAAAKLHQNDVRRIIRALEVYKITGEPLSHQQMQFDEGVSAERCKVFVLGWSRGALHARIDARVDWMFAAGLVEEVRELLVRFGELGRTAAQAVGYRESLGLPAGSRFPCRRLERRVKVRTHQFARRQETWFRSLSECRRIEMDGVGNPAEVAEKLLELGQATGV